jgi:hypothetical protein
VVHRRNEVGSFPLELARRRLRPRKDIQQLGVRRLTLGQEWSGYAGMLAENLERIDDALRGVYRLALGGKII